MGAELVVIIGGIAVLFAVLATIVRYDREKVQEAVKEIPRGDWPYPIEEKKVVTKGKVVVNKKTNKKSR